MFWVCLWGEFQEIHNPRVQEGVSRNWRQVSIINIFQHFIMIFISKFHRCEDYAISLLEQCEDLREVEIFLQTKYSGNKDANYILAILGMEF